MRLPSLELTSQHPVELASEYTNFALSHDLSTKKFDYQMKWQNNEFDLYKESVFNFIYGDIRSA